MCFNHQTHILTTPGVRRHTPPPPPPPPPPPRHAEHPNWLALSNFAQHPFSALTAVPGPCPWTPLRLQDPRPVENTASVYLYTLEGGHGKIWLWRMRLHDEPTTLSNLPKRTPFTPTHQDLISSVSPTRTLCGFLSWPTSVKHREINKLSTRFLWGVYYKTHPRSSFISGLNI